MSLLVDLEKLRAPIRSIDDIPDGSESGVHEEPMCVTYSRGNALCDHLRVMVEDYRAENLRYLLRGGAVLCEQEIGLAIEEIEQLLRAFADEPLAFLASMDKAWSGKRGEHGEREMAMLRVELGKAPNPDVEGQYDWGDDWRYLIGFLKSHQSVLRAARERAVGVIYAQDGGEEA